METQGKCTRNKKNKSTFQFDSVIFVAKKKKGEVNVAYS